MDSTINDIYFDKAGICKYCNIHDFLEKRYPVDSQRVLKIVEKIKHKSKGKKYDCIVGVSGGRDSSYLLYTAVKMGLKPLAVHFDNGWNSEIAVSNIRHLLQILNVELTTIVADWEEFKQMQIAFLKASVPDVDIVTDYAIYSVLYETAAKHKIPFVLNGHSFRTEGSVPVSWTYMDGRYIRSVNKRYNNTSAPTSFPMLTLLRFVYLSMFKRIKEVRLLEMLDYNKNQVDPLLEEQCNWKDYGGHHHECHYTKFIQTYFLPLKFGIDKRIVELSTRIRTGKLSKEEAKKLLSSSAAVVESQSTIEYVLKKLSLSKQAFNDILKLPVKSHTDFKTYKSLIVFLKLPIKWLAKIGVLPYILYLKYASK